MGSPLLIKSKQFALDIIKVCNKVKSDKRESALTNQLIRSGTSIGANIREAFYGHGKNDFIAKLQIALKECSDQNFILCKKSTHLCKYTKVQKTDKNYLKNYKYSYIILICIKSWVFAREI